MRTPVRTVTDDHGNELTIRRCRECGAWKPADTEHFYPTTKRGRSGLTGQCRPCKKRLVAEQRALNLSHPETAAEYRRRTALATTGWRQRNPEKWARSHRATSRRRAARKRAEIAELKRIDYRLAAERDGRTVRTGQRTAIGAYREDRKGTLSAAPLQAWLEAVTASAPLRDLSAVLDVDERVIWRVRHGEHDNVTLAVAAHLLTRYNRPVVIRSRDLERRLVEWAQGLPGNGGRLLAYLDRAETVAHLADRCILTLEDLWPSLGDG